MGMLALVLDARDAKLATAVEQANQWAVTAGPLVKAIFAIEDAEGELLAGCDLRTWQEAKPILATPKRELREMLDGLRDNFIADQMLPQPAADAVDDAWDERDEFQDALEREVIGVDALIVRMGREA